MLNPDEILANAGVSLEEVRDLTEALVLAKSPNPPGDVTLPMRVAGSYLARNGIPYTLMHPAEGFYNIIAQVDGGQPGPHLVMNAHLDTFPDPIKEMAGWEVQEFPVNEPCVQGLGSSDMKGGAAVFMTVLKTLNAQRGRLRGKASLCLVGDEETFGPFGSRAVLKAYPDLYGDALLSTEPSGLADVEYGERGFVWGVACFERMGGHASMPMSDTNAIEAAGHFTSLLRNRLAAIQSQEDADTGSEETLRESMLRAANTVSLNFGTIQGGIKVNMQPRRCEVGVDVRIPRGVTVSEVVRILEACAEDSGGRYTLENSGEANANEASNWLFTATQSNAEYVTGKRPEIVFSVGCSDTRLWRYAGVPAVVYGPEPGPMAHAGEYVTHSDLWALTRVHTLTAFQFLGGDR